jgi:hypothetical protein
MKDILKVKRRRGLVLAQQCPGSLGTCNPEETGLPELPVSWSPTLFSRFGLIGLPPIPWIEKTIERLPFFVWHGGHCCLQKLEQWAKKCIELCEEYVEELLSLVAVACFPLGQAKDLSAPPHTLSCHHRIVNLTPGTCKEISYYTRVLYGYVLKLKLVKGGLFICRCILCLGKYSNYTSTVDFQPCNVGRKWS